MIIHFTGFYQGLWVPDLGFFWTLCDGMKVVRIQWKLSGNFEFGTLTQLTLCSPTPVMPGSGSECNAQVSFVARLEQPIP